jgi:ligand-binding SRPBCC domain-containing protein
MKLVLKTDVQQAPPQVWAGFDQALFEKLAPPFPRIRLLRFDGSTTGCTVEVELNFIFFRQIWQSKIIEHGHTEDAIWFVDQGTRLPFFLKSWRHRHSLLRSETGTQIVDDIDYGTGWSMLDYLMYPLMWAQFAYRGPIYRRAFRRLQ